MTVRTLRFVAKRLDAGGVDELLYEVPVDRRALVHSLAAFNRGEFAAMVLLWVGDDPDDGITLAVDDLQPGESVFRPLEDVWNAGEQVWALVTAGAEVTVRASGSLLVL